MPRFGGLPSTHSLFSWRSTPILLSGITGSPGAHSPLLANQPLPHQTQVLSWAAQERKKLWVHQHLLTALESLLLPEPPEIWLSGPSPARLLPRHWLCACPTAFPVILPWLRAARMHSCCPPLENLPPQSVPGRCPETSCSTTQAPRGLTSILPGTLDALSHITRWNLPVFHR